MSPALPFSFAFAFAVLALTSCSAEEAERSEPPAAADWKNSASVLTIAAPDGPTDSYGTYFRPEGDPGLSGSIFEDLITCGIRRFEVNQLPNMHGSELQVVIPRDAYLVIARGCLQRTLPPGTRLQVYDWRADRLNQDIQQDSARADAALHAYRQRNGLGPEDPISFEADETQNAQSGSAAAGRSSGNRVD